VRQSEAETVVAHGAISKGQSCKKGLKRALSQDRNSRFLSQRKAPSLPGLR